MERTVNGRIREILNWHNAVAVTFTVGGLLWKALDIGGRVELLLSAIGEIGGTWAMLAQIVGSTYFGIGLTAVGVGYAVLGKAPVKPVVGRVGSALLLMFGCAAVLVATSAIIFGYVELKIRDLASQREESYAIWQLTPDEQDRFAASIKSLPPTSRIGISFLPTSSQAGMFASSLTEAIAKDGIYIRPASDYSVNLSLVGVYVVIDENHRKDRIIPKCAGILIAALKSVGVKPSTGTKDNVGADGCSIVIGIKPPDGR